MKFYFRLIDKQAKSGRDTDDIVDAMNNDSTNCCRTKQSRAREATKPKKRPREASDDSSGETSTSTTSGQSKKKPMSKKHKVQVTKVTLVSDASKPTPPKKASPLPQSIEAMPDLSAFCTAELGGGDDAPAADDEPACVPDLFEFLSNRSASITGAESEPEVTAPAVMPPLSVPTNPAPIVIQNVLSGNAAQRNINSMGGSSQGSSPSNRPVVRTQSVTRVSANTIRVNATPTTTEPVFHMINGYRIDLNSAAQQNTIRLPNGKIIHVKKQPVLPNGQIGRQPNPRLPIRATAQQVRNTAVPQQTQRPMQRPPRPPAARQQANVANQAVPTQSAASRVNSRMQLASASAMLQSMHAMQQHHQQQQQQQQAMQTNVPQIQQPLHPSVIAQQNKNSIVAAGPRKYPGGPVGNARTQFERQIFNGLEICQHIESKLKTLMNSNAYKNVRNVNDIKELQIHMSYLLSFTLGRFKTLQEKCMDDMRKLGFASEADSLSEGNVIKKYGSDNDEDDIEIVEPQHATINVDDSDDDQPKKTPEKTTTRKKTTVTPPSHLASAIAAAQSLVASMTAQKTTPARVAPITRIERTPSIPRIESAPQIEPTEVSIADSSTEDIECEVDMMALLQPQVILNDHDDLELPMPPPLSPPPPPTPPPSADDPKLKSKAEVRLKKADEEFPELMTMLSQTSKANSKTNAVDNEFDENENDEQSEIVPVEGDVENDSTNRATGMEDDVVADYESAIHRLQELSSEFCASPTSLTNASAQAERTEADNTIDEFVSVLEISDSSIKSTSSVEDTTTNEPMSTDDFMSILDLPEDIIAAVDEVSQKTTTTTDETNDGGSVSELAVGVEPPNAVESEITEMPQELSNEVEEDAKNAEVASNEKEELKNGQSESAPVSDGKDAESSVEKTNVEEETVEEDGKRAPENVETNDQVPDEPLQVRNSNDNDAQSSDEKTTTDIDSVLPTEKHSTLNEFNDNVEDHFEDISSPDTFDDYSKNGVAGKNNDCDIFDDAIDELICENISAIAN